MEITLIIHVDTMNAGISNLEHYTTLFGSASGSCFYAEALGFDQQVFLGVFITTNVFFDFRKENVVASLKKQFSISSIISYRIIIGSRILSPHPVSLER